MQSNANIEAVRYAYCLDKPQGGYSYSNIIRAFEQGAEWQSSEMVDPIKFAEFCGKWGEIGFDKRRGKWLIDDVEEITTEQLLELYKKTLIPQLPFPWQP